MFIKLAIASTVNNGEIFSWSREIDTKKLNTTEKIVKYLIEEGNAFPEHILIIESENNIPFVSRWLIEGEDYAERKE